MSGIRVNEWLHNSGTGGIWQTSAGNVGIASSVPTAKLVVTGDANISGIATAETFVPTVGQLSHRNLIINGNMRVAQRGDTTGVQDGYGGCDRFKFVGNSAARATLARTTGTALNGFGSCQLVNCTTADASLAAGDYHYLGYRFEGQDLYLLKKGTANAESVTLSFWVSSPKTGTHIIQLYDNDNGRHVCKSYTVSSADTWEYKTLTFAGDTTGSLDNNADYSLQIYFWLLAGSNYTSGSLATSWASFTAANAAVGQVNCLDSTSNNFKLTGVQLEVGSVATPFEHRSYGDQLARCRRYFQKIKGGDGDYTGFSGYSETTSAARFPVRFEPPMRADPTFTMAGTLRFQGATNDSATFTSGVALQSINETFDGASLQVTGTSSLGAADRPGNLQFKASSSSLSFDAEL